MDTKTASAKKILEGSGITVLDAARLIRNIIDEKDARFGLPNAGFCKKVIDAGLRSVRYKEETFASGFEIYLEQKRHLRPDSIRDIRAVGRRMIRLLPALAGKNFSEFTTPYCERSLAECFTTPSQFNKARAIIHAFFEFALRREWCDRNPVRLVERKKVVEREIVPLKLDETKRLFSAARRTKNANCIAAVALLLYAGIRPREVRRMKWRDMDLRENTITVRSQCSKTGGVRQVEICPALRRILLRCAEESECEVCPKNWQKKWRQIRSESGFDGCWVQDILRHTYASYHAKHFGDLPRLQLNMGHSDLSLLRARYVNMYGISRSEARMFFK